jgi:hypothetical protein
VADRGARLCLQRASGPRTTRTAICLSLALILAVLSGAQSSQQVPLRRQQDNPNTALGDLNDRGPAEKEKQLRTLNALRQKAMISDTAKLLQLATELNAEVSADNSDSLTPSELRKVAAIEKLARSVKQRMSVAVGGGIDDRDPFISTAP